MATVREHFDSDFPEDLKAHADWTVKVANTGEEVPVVARVHMNHTTNCRFVSFYAAECANPEQIATHLATEAERALSVASGIQVTGGYQNEQVNLTSAPFTKGVYVYIDADVSEEAIARIAALGAARGLVVRVRGRGYAESHTKSSELLAFVSHDSRDKEEVARPLARALMSRLCSIWYDEYSLRIGDNLIESIQRGIAKCKKCILIISPHFISNGGWTKAEFQMIITRELHDKEGLILPVWHNVSSEQVYDYCPILANRFAIRTDRGIKEVAGEIYKVLRQ
jgi:hypothetical protein